MNKDKALDEQLKVVKKIIKGMAKFNDEMKKLGIKCDTKLEVTATQEKKKK
jgi:hypothetical protein